jgi:hypothetical protein
MSATRAFGARVIREPRKGHGSGFGIVVTTFAELGRALAAAQRYEDLRYRSAGHASIDPADIPRRVFEELYASGEVSRPQAKPSNRSAPRR